MYFDPLPTNIPKKCIDLLLPAIHHIVNLSLNLGCFPDVLKKACPSSSIENENLGSDSIENFRPVSNLLFLNNNNQKMRFSPN